jgi:hypothetical protein
LFAAYHLKERFNQIWRDGEGLFRWQDWKDDAKNLPEQRFQGIIDLVEDKRHELTPCFEQVEISKYERWLDEVQAYEIRGTHSFAAARLALLTKYGEPPKSTHLSTPSEEALSEVTLEETLSEEDYAAIDGLSEIGKVGDDE